MTTEKTTSVFDALEGEDRDEQERREGARAIAAARERIRGRFGRFLENGRGDARSWNSRVAFVEDEVNGIIAAATEEYGGDAETVSAAASLPTFEAGGGHASDCTCAFCKNKGKLPGSKSDEKDDGKSDEKFQGNGDKDTDGDEKDDGKGKKPWESSVKTAGVCHECHHPMDKHSADGMQGPNGVGCEFCDCKRTIAEDETHSASTRWAVVATGPTPETGDNYTQERVSLPSGGGDANDGLGGPVPKIDKGKSGDQDGWTLADIKDDSKAHPTEHQDIHGTAVWDETENGQISQKSPDINDSDFDKSSPTRKRVDADEPIGKEQKGETGQWTDIKGADPVTSRYHLLTAKA